MSSRSHSCIINIECENKTKKIIHKSYPKSDQNRHCNKSYSNLSSHENYTNQTKTKSPVSLINIGDNGYLNSGLQAISACSDFIKELNTLQNTYPSLKKLKLFYDLIKTLSSGYERNLTISDNEIFCNWNKQGQQDSFELLTYIMNQVYDEIRNEKQIDRNKLMEWFKVELPFRIIIEYEIKCCKPLNGQNRHQSDLALHIPIPKVKNDKILVLQDLLDQIFLNEKIEDYLCDENNCTGNNAVKMMKLCLPLPNAICIHLQRLFWNDVKMEKIEDKIKFEKDIIIKKQFICNSLISNNKSVDCEDQTYQLKSVIVHYGNANVGHYICYKYFNGSWFYTSDSSIRKVDFKDVLGCQAYILFYDKRDISSIAQNSSIKETIRDISPSTNSYSSRIRQGLTKDHNSNNTSHIKLLQDSNINSMQTSKAVLNKKSSIESISKTQSPISKHRLNILVQAFSSCSILISRLEQLQTEQYIAHEFQEIIDKIISNENPMEFQYLRIGEEIIERLESLDICEMMETIINSVFQQSKNNDSSNTTINQLNTINPMEMYFGNDCLCKNFKSSSIKSRLVIHLDWIYSNIQWNFDYYFTKLFNYCSNTNCRFKLSYNKLLTLPDIICLHIQKNYSCIEYDNIVIKKSYLALGNIDHIEPIKNNDCQSIIIDYKYNIKSIIKIDQDKYECYKIYDKQWYHICENEIKKIEKYSIKINFDALLFYESDNCMNSNILPNSNNNLSIDKNHTFTNNQKQKSSQQLIESINNNHTIRDNLKPSKQLVETKKSTNSNILSTSNNNILSKRGHNNIEQQENLIESVKRIKIVDIDTQIETRNNNYKYINESYYLEICLHALLSCKKWLEEIKILEYPKSNKIIKLIKSLNYDCFNIVLSSDINDYFAMSYQSHLFHFLSTTLFDPFKQMNMNCLRIEMVKTEKCLCGEKYEFIESEFYLKINDITEKINLQKAVENIFKDKIIISEKCTNNKCSETTREMSVKLKKPFPKIICIHIEKLIWNGVKNISYYYKVEYCENIFITNEFYENKLKEEITLNITNNNLIYCLRSILVHISDNKYGCYRRHNNNWYKITNYSLNKVDDYELKSSQPYILFYELVE